MDLEAMIDSAVTGLKRGARGRAAAPPSMLRRIERDDLPAILARPAAAPAERPMLRIRHQHHLAAKLVAEGKRPGEISLITGYSVARIGQLRNDPSFGELVEHYKEQATEKWLNVHERLAALGVTVTEELMERLEDSPDDFSNEELRKLAETLLDRGGFGPQSTRNVNLKSQSLTLSLVEQIKAESENRGRVDNLIEHQDN